ncbi:MAG: outer membrane protein, partial [Bacteroidota bacterium]
MKRLLSIFLAVGLCGQVASAQNVLWASKVIEVSSEYKDANNPGQYAAKEALGPPSIDPAVSKGTECAWSPSEGDIDKEEYITLGYEKAIRIQQIAISEAMGAGSLVKVILFNGNTPTVVWTNPAKGPGPTSGKMTNIFITPTEFACNKVMVVLNPKLVTGYNHIDAVGISESTDTIKAKINLAPGILTDGIRENLGPNVNSVTDELLPVITPDGQSLYITRQGHPNNMGNVDFQDIYVSKRNPDGTWGEATNIGAPLNNTDNNAVAAITPDGQTLLLLNKFKEGAAPEVGVSYARKIGETWGTPVGQDIDNFYNRSTYGEYALAASGKTMILAIQRDNGVGGKDLHVSFLKPDGAWTEPQNMGVVVNTAGGESTPFLAADDATLYFSTNGRVGYGSKDMYMTRRLDSTWTNWSEPQNLGPLLNTPAWDAYYSIPASGDYAYFVSYQNS